ncbi:MAG: aromatic prenyltransferase [Candidatus Odinarchaeota archaeon]
MKLNKESSIGTSLSFKHKNDLERLFNDIKSTSKIAGVTCNDDATWKVLNVFKEFYTGSAISIRTTTRPVDKRDVSARYVELGVPHDPDPYSIALAEGLLAKDGHLVHDLFDEIQARYTIAGYGIDLDARHGLSKIWPFIFPAPVDTVCSLSSFPISIKNYAEHFQKFGLNLFSLFAIDYLHRTSNVYFLIKNPKQATTTKVSRMLEDLDFMVPPQEILEYCCRAATIYYTFSWESDRVERICFGMVAPEPALVPSHLHPLMRRFTARAPMQSTKRMFIYSIAFSQNGYLIKIESDYTGTMINLLMQAAANLPE